MCSCFALIYLAFCIQLGFLDFTLFSEEPEFYATYQIQNVKTGKLYSSKFSIHLVDLSQIELATEEDRADAEFWERHTRAQLQKQAAIIQEQEEALQQKDETIAMQAELIRKLQDQVAGNFLLLHCTNILNRSGRYTNF